MPHQRWYRRTQGQWRGKGLLGILMQHDYHYKSWHESIKWHTYWYQFLEFGPKEQRIWSSRRKLCQLCGWDYSRMESYGYDLGITPPITLIYTGINIPLSLLWFSAAKLKIHFQWRHYERDSVSNHQPHDCILSSLFRQRSKKTSKLLVTGLCAGNSPVTGEFPEQRASNAENFPILMTSSCNEFRRL